jgi:hypothetical protein
MTLHIQICSDSLMFSINCSGFLSMMTRLLKIKFIILQTTEVIAMLNYYKIQIFGRDFQTEGQFNILCVNQKN